MTAPDDLDGKLGTASVPDTPDNRIAAVRHLQRRHELGVLAGQHPFNHLLVAFDGRLGVLRTQECRQDAHVIAEYAPRGVTIIDLPYRDLSFVSDWPRVRR